MKANRAKARNHLFRDISIPVLEAVSRREVIEVNIVAEAKPKFALPSKAAICASS
jgi:hypothetical protein